MKTTKKTTPCRHTPAPWRVEPAVPGEASGVHVYAKNSAGDSVTIADFIENDANARLIADAPDLLEACRKTVEENLHLADGDDCALIHLKRAIAKAEGR